MVKIPNWQNADQSAIYKYVHGVDIVYQETNQVRQAPGQSWFDKKKCVNYTHLTFLNQAEGKLNMYH